MVSVIVPVYNVEKYIDRCIESIIQQTYTKLQIILVDDKSTDLSGIKCDQWSKRDDRIQVIHKKENEGLGYARNTGLEYAEGQYVVFVDSDDFLRNDHIELLLESLTNHNADMAICSYVRYQSDLRVDYMKNVSSELIIEKQDIVDKVLLSIIAAPSDDKREVVRETSVWLNIYLKKYIDEKKLRFVSERTYGSEDMLFNIDYISQCNRVVMIPECTYFYRYNGLSLSNSYRISRMNEICMLTKMVRNELRQLNLLNKAEHRLERMLILKTRRTLMIVSNLDNMDLLEKLRTIKSILNIYDVREALKNYPIKKYSIVQKISAYIMRYRLSLMMYIYGRIYKRLKG